MNLQSFTLQSTKVQNTILSMLSKCITRYVAYSTVGSRLLKEKRIVSLHLNSMVLSHPFMSYMTWVNRVSFGVPSMLTLRLYGSLLSLQVCKWWVVKSLMWLLLTMASRISYWLLWGVGRVLITLEMSNTPSSLVLAIRNLTWSKPSDGRQGEIRQLPASASNFMKHLDHTIKIFDKTLGMQPLNKQP